MFVLLYNGIAVPRSTHIKNDKNTERSLCKANGWAVFYLIVRWGQGYIEGRDS
jgi:hypothetical protein